jgi:hypothetical protein
MKNRKWPFKYHDRTQLLLLFPPLMPARSGCSIRKAHLCVHLVLTNMYPTHEGKTEEENNGYVVFKLTIHGSAGK